MRTIHQTANSTWSRGKVPVSHPECVVCQRRIAKQRALRQRWRAAKVCHQCGSPCLKYATCMTCRAYQAQRQKDRRARKRQQKAA